jgi:tRNA 2-selenouridine synthase
MDCMRASECVSVQLSQQDRVALLMEDYTHFLDAPDALNAQLDCLSVRYGMETIGRWQQMALQGQMAPLVEELLAQHYDPAYLKSIDRNFSRFAQAMTLEIAGVSAEAFDDAASRLLLAESAKNIA